MLTAIALLSLTAIAGATPLDDDPAFRAGLSFYESLELEKAAFRFQAAAGAAALPPADRARAYAWLGVTLVQLGELDDAAAAFADAVAQDPSVALPTKAPPQAEQLLADAKAGGALLPPLAPLVEAPPAPSTATAPASPPWLLVSGGALVGAGVGVAVAATVVGVRALVVAEQAKAEPFHGAAGALYREAEADALVANALWAGAAAGVVGGAGIVAAAVILE